jgi:hypothetical protein
MYCNWFPHLVSCTDCEIAMFNDVHSLNVQNSNVSQVQGDQNNNFIVTNVALNDAETTLGLLKPVARDGYHVPRCMEGTRESVFKEVITWLNSAHIPSFNAVLD